MADIIAQRIGSARARLGWTQRKAADAARISQPTWQRIESGDKRPTVSQLASIAGALGRSLSYFTDAKPVDERLVVATRTSSPTPSAEEMLARDEAVEHLKYLMKVDAHLRAIGIGVHPGA